MLELQACTTMPDYLLILLKGFIIVYKQAPIMPQRLGQGLQQATGHLVLSIPFGKLGEETPRSPKLKWNGQVTYH